MKVEGIAFSDVIGSCSYIIRNRFYFKYLAERSARMDIIVLRCIVSIALFRTFARPMIQGVHATGDVKFLNLSSGLFNALTYLPLIYILYWSGLPVWSCFIYIQPVL